MAKDRTRHARLRGRGRGAGLRGRVMALAESAGAVTADGLIDVGRYLDFWRARAAAGAGGGA
ncbi:MAG: hypothetical protein MR611_04785 [Coriobacteriaceae bacterium]|nr:hypothetical protein [Coriobacteriaceae bacterium]